MTDKKRVVSLCLSLILIFSFAGCKNREDSKNDVDGSVSTETIENKTENSIVGTWVVEKNEFYDGPLKEIFKQQVECYYPVGSEYIFTDDGICKSADGKANTTYKILSDNKISFIAVNNGDTVINDYVLNGDSLVIYGCYTDNVHTGYIGATYYKRKGV